MGIFDPRPVHGSLDETFDMNRDGFIDSGEEALEYNYIKSINAPSSSYLDEEEAIFDEIEGMDREEASEFLESEGYDIDDFDF